MHFSGGRGNSERRSASFRVALDAEASSRFEALLDRPVQDNPSLAKLFAKPSLFE
jgi:uncharacterized protein (DUF1778 family)